MSSALKFISTGNSHDLGLKRTMFICIITAGFLFHAAAHAQTDDCDLKRDRDGIKVYTCKSEDEKFKSLRAEFVIENVSIQELEKFLRDVPNYPTWQYNMIAAEILERRGDNEIVYRSEIDAPWPVEDRELLMRFWSERDEAGYTYFNMENTSYNYPLSEDLVRVPYMKGRWKVKETKNNTLEIEYVMHINPGGMVPAWLVNIAMADGPHHSFKNLREQIYKK